MTPSTDTRVSAGPSLPRRLWTAWRGELGDDVIQTVGIIALLTYVANHHGFPDPLPVAVFACLLLHGRYSDRAALTKARAASS